MRAARPQAMRTRSRTGRAALWLAGCFYALAVCSAVAGGSFERYGPHDVYVQRGELWGGLRGSADRGGDSDRLCIKQDGCQRNDRRGRSNTEYEYQRQSAYFLCGGADWNQRGCCDYVQRSLRPLRDRGLLTEELYLSDASGYWKQWTCRGSSYTDSYAGCTGWRGSDRRHVRQRGYDGAILGRWDAGIRGRSWWGDEYLLRREQDFSYGADQSQYDLHSQQRRLDAGCRGLLGLS